MPSISLLEFNDASDVFYKTVLNAGLNLSEYHINSITSKGNGTYSVNYSHVPPVGDNSGRSCSVIEVTVKSRPYNSIW